MARTATRPAWTTARAVAFAQPKVPPAPSRWCPRRCDGDDPAPLRRLGERRRCGTRDRRLGGRDTGDRDPEGRAGDVVESGGGEEPDGVRVAPVLAADAELEVRPGGAPALHRQLDQLADPVDVDRL